MSVDENDREQFEKYLKGKMCNEDAHSFEKEVLNDPFAQEALEGLEDQPVDTVFADMQKLQSNIVASKKASFSLLKIAAVVSLLIVSSIAAWIVVDPLAKDEVLAMESEIEMEDSEEKPKQEFVAEEPESNTSEEKIVEEKTSTTASNENSDTEMIEVAPAEVAELAEGPAGGDTFFADDALAEVVVEEVLLEDSNEQLQAASGFASEDVQILSVDEIANDVDQAESPPKLDVSNAVSRTSAEVDKVASKREAEGGAKEVNDVPATARIARARSASGMQIQKPTDVRSVAVPEIGETEFKKYLEENMIYPQAAIDNDIKGTVVLELTISSTGEITNIDVKRSLGYGCDEEAIRLIQDGSKWKPATRNNNPEQDKVRVKVRFKR